MAVDEKGDLIRQKIVLLCPESMAIKVIDKLLPEIFGGVADPMYLKILYLLFILNPRLPHAGVNNKPPFFFCILSYSYSFQVI